MNNFQKKKLSIGVLGCSRVAVKNMLPAILDSEFAELAMVGSRMLDNAKSVAKQFGCDSYGLYESVIASQRVDAVYISLPNSMHEEWAIKAANAGKHVLCEKPAAISYAAAKKMADAARKNKVRIFEGLMFRYHPQHAKVKEMISGGTLGDLLRFDGVFGYPKPTQENIRMKSELGGGSFYDAMPYPVYASRMIFGEEPESVFCKLRIDREKGVDVRAEIMAFYPDGKIAFMSSIFDSYFQSKYSILGSKAMARVERAYAVPRDMKTKILLDANDSTREIYIEPADHFCLMLDDFCGEILSGAVKTKFEEDLLAQARIMEAAGLSNRENRLVRISDIN